MSIAATYGIFRPFPTIATRIQTFPSNSNYNKLALALQIRLSAGCNQARNYSHRLVSKPHLRPTFHTHYYLLLQQGVHR